MVFLKLVFEFFVLAYLRKMLFKLGNLQIITIESLMIVEYFGKDSKYLSFYKCRYMNVDGILKEFA